jgi:hypothetical protein
MMRGNASAQATYLKSGVPGAGAGRPSRWRRISSSTRRHAVPLLPPYTDGVRGRVLTSSDCAFTSVRCPGGPDAPPQPQVQASCVP